MVRMDWRWWELVLKKTTEGLETEGCVLRTRVGGIHHKDRWAEGGDILADKKVFNPCSLG